MGDDKDQKHDKAAIPERKQEHHEETLHDKDAANATSLAGLRREEESVKKKNALHTASNSESIDATKMALLLLATEFHAWRPQLNKEMSNAGSAAPGSRESSVAAANVKKIYTSARDELNRVADIVSTLPVGRLREIESEMAAMTREFMHAQDAFATAINWHTDQKTGETLSRPELDNAFNRYSKKNDMTPTALPKGSTDDVAKTAIDKQLAAADLAIDAIRAGNADEAKRVVMHVRYLEVLKNSHPQAFTGTQPRFRHMLEQLEALKSTRPELDPLLTQTRESLPALAKP